MPSCDIKPIVGFIAYNAALLAGMIMLPQVSVPIEIGAKPALTPTAEPVDEPPGF